MEIRREPQPCGLGAGPFFSNPQAQCTYYMYCMSWVKVSSETAHLSRLKKLTEDINT